MTTYIITLGNSTTCEVSADLHYTDDKNHLFYTYEEGLVLTCSIQATVKEI